MAHMSKQPGSTECRSAAEIAQCPKRATGPVFRGGGVQGLGKSCTTLHRLGSRMCGEKR